MTRSGQRRQRPHPADRAFGALWRALRPHLGAHRLRAANSEDWASATFVGARHMLCIVLDGDDAAPRALKLHAMLSETELPIVGGLVADLQAIVLVEPGRVMLGIEALTIEEDEDALSRDARPAA